MGWLFYLRRNYFLAVSLPASAGAAGAAGVVVGAGAASVAGVGAGATGAAAGGGVTGALGSSLLQATSERVAKAATMRVRFISNFL